MPKKTTATPAPTASAATTRPPATAPALPPAAQAVLALLDTENGSTAAELSERAGVARSTVGKALSALLERHLAVRRDGGHDGTRRIADLWFAAPAASAHPATTDAERAEAPAPDGDSAPTNHATGDGAEPGAAGHGESADATAQDARDGAIPHDETATAEGSAAPEQAHADPDAPDTEDQVGSQSEADGESGRDEPAADPDAQDPEAPDAEPGPGPGTSNESAKQGPDQTHAADGPGSAPVTAEGDSAAPRLGKGELRAKVEAHLRANPDQAWTPTALSKVLDRSAGAINNACVKLTEDATVTTLPDKPIRFQWNGRGSADPS